MIIDDLNTSEEEKIEKSWKAWEHTEEMELSWEKGDWESTQIWVFEESSHGRKNALILFLLIQQN
jgi:hypothetical protein